MLGRSGNTTARHVFTTTPTNLAAFLAEPIPLAKTVRGGDTINWHGLTIRVMETPGYTRGAVSHLVEIESKRIACVMHSRGDNWALLSIEEVLPIVEECSICRYTSRPCLPVNGIAC